MLVLLIIFMVSAPLMQQGIQVDLPKTKAQALSDQESQIVLVVDSRGQAMINKNIIPASQLSEKIKAIFAKREKKEIYVQADRSVAYGVVANIMATVQSAGVTRVGLVTEPVQK
jgi:biopolymer transport protein TolR